MNEIQKLTSEERASLGPTRAEWYDEATFQCTQPGQNSIYVWANRTSKLLLDLSALMFSLRWALGQIPDVGLCSYCHVYPVRKFDPHLHNVDCPWRQAIELLEN